MDKNYSIDCCVKWFKIQSIWPIHLIFEFGKIMKNEQRPNFIKIMMVMVMVTTTVTFSQSDHQNCPLTINGSRKCDTDFNETSPQLEEGIYPKDVDVWETKQNQSSLTFIVWIGFIIMLSIFIFFSIYRE